jgi:hypothetical protein
MVRGMEVSGSITDEKQVCKPCLEGKQPRKPIPDESTIENPRVLHRTYSDVCGPMETPSQTGHRYFMTFIDACSHLVTVKLLKTKDEAFGSTKVYFERAEAETGERANYFRSDGGGEYGSSDFLKYLESKGIHHEKTNAYTPQENGVAERMNRTLVESARAMLNDAGLPKKYWGDAILHTAHILNRVPTRALKENLTPHEVFTGNKPSVAHIRVFGCKAYVHVPDERRRKLDAKSMECIHLGYAEHRKAFVCLQRSSGRVIESRDVVFDENDDGGPSRVNIQVDGTGTEPIQKGKQPIEAKDLPANNEPVANDAVHVEETLHDDEGDLEDFLRSEDNRGDLEDFLRNDDKEIHTESISSLIPAKR